MMSNLFSIFDSSTNNILELNWLSSILNIFIIPLPFWFLKSRFMKIINLMMSTLYSEFKMIMISKFNSLNSIFFITLFMFILINNLMGLYPYIFTSSSHLIFSLTFSLPLWISLMMFGWFNNTNYMFSHMIPQGTPIVLMPFMVMIESTSNIIRPMTLSIRLTANMIAGHLLLTLLSKTAITPLMMITIMVILTQIILLILEFSVSIIQSYVFTILSILYTKEINYE